MMMDFKWLGSEVGCYSDNLSLQNGSFKFYRSFLYNGEEFCVGEFALFKQINKADFTRIGRLLCVFESQERTIKYNGIVRWYTWARNLEHKLNSLTTKFDKNNEIVEEMPSLDARVSLKDIEKKCNVVCATLDEPTYLIKKNNLNPDVYFICRYKMEHNQLVPYFSEDGVDYADNGDYIVSSDLNALDGEKSDIVDASEDSGSSVMEKKCSTKFHGKNSKGITDSSPLSKTTPIKTSPTKVVTYKKRKSSHTAPIILLDSEGSDVEERYVDKVKSPSNPSKNLKLTPKSGERKVNGSLLSPLKRNLSVKRVLNDSFDDHPTSPSGIPIFSYSIINSNYNDPKQIKIKLKLSEDQTNVDLKVFPTKLDDEIFQIKSPLKINDLREINNCVELSPNAKAKMSEMNCAVDSPCQLRSSTQGGSSYTPAKITSTRRRSSRIIQRQSYAEYYSPEGHTPKKRVRRTSTDNHCSYYTTKTPFKEIAEITTSLSKIDEDEHSNVDKKQKIKIRRQDYADHDTCNNVRIPTVVTSNNQTNMTTPKCSVGRPKKLTNDGNTHNNQIKGNSDSNKKTEYSKQHIGGNTDSVDASSSDENDKPAKTNFKAITSRVKHKIINQLTNIENCNMSLKKDVESKSISDTNEKLLLTAPRLKRSVGTPKRYINNDNGNSMENLTPKQKRNVGYSTKSNNDVDSAKSSRTTRSVGRPKKYNDSEDEDSSSSTVTSPRLKRSVGRPKKYNEKSNNSNNKDTINRQSSKLIRSVGYLKNDDDAAKRAKSPRVKRNAGRPRKYIENNESDDSDSDDHTSKKTRSQIKNNSKTPTKISYSNKKIGADNIHASVLKNSRKKLMYTESEEDDFEPPTPKTQRQKTTAGTPRSTVKDTPTARARMIREGIITPSVQARNKAVLKDSTPLSKARTQLHVSFVPKSLPCREKEFANIINFLEGKLLDGCGGCMYVSGVPGTGKTATVTEVIRSLHTSVESGKLPSFKYVNVNGMRLSEPRQSYVEILRQLAGKTVHWEQAQTMLENRFVKSQKKSAPIILVVDELDILCTKRQDVVYNLLDWPTKANAQLIVITIANTMDLPERLLMGRVTSRLGLTRLTFQAYTHKQLQEIVSKRLFGISAFNPDAIQLVARKVASVSGDARRALDICRRAVEIAELEGKQALVSMTHVNQALNAMITQPKVQAIKRCSRLEKLILQAVVAEVERTGVEETNFTSVLTMLVPIAALDGFQMVSSTIAMAAVSKLGACRLLLTDQKCNNIYQRIILNVSADDVYYALTKTDI